MAQIIDIVDKESNIVSIIIFQMFSMLEERLSLLSIDMEDIK